MVKKLIILGLALALLVSCCACGATASEIESAANEIEKELTENAGEIEKELSDALSAEDTSYSIETDEPKQYTFDDGTVFGVASFDRVVFANESDAALAAIN